MTVIAVGLVAALGVGGLRPAAAGTATTCGNFTTLAPGNYSSVTVANGPCTLPSGVTVSGAVTLQGRGTIVNLEGATIGSLNGQAGAFFFEFGTINGDINLTSALVFIQANLCGTPTVNGNETISGAENVVLQSANIGQSMSVQSSQTVNLFRSTFAGSVRIEGTYKSILLDGNQIGGSLTVINNMPSSGIVITNNQVSNYLTVNNNTSAGVQISGNTAGGLFSCTNNTPAATGSGNTGQFVGSACNSG